MKKNEFRKEFEKIFKDEYSHATKNKKIWKERSEKRLSLHFLRPDKLNLINKFTSLKGKKVLDLGSGYGDFLVYASRKEAKIIGIEPNFKRVVLSKKRLKLERKKDNIVYGKGEKLPFPDNSFDIVWCDNVIEHCQDVHTLIKEILRVKKPEGYAFLFAPNYQYPFEVHYKRFYPLIPSKKLVIFYFKLIGEPTEYISDVNFVTQRGIRKFIESMNVRFYDPIWEKLRKTGNIIDKKKAGLVNILNTIGVGILLYYFYPHIQYVFLSESKNKKERKNEKA